MICCITADVSSIGTDAARRGRGNQKLVLGMISGYGRDTMATKGVPVDSIYYIPNLRNWFVESTVPVHRGDTVRRDTVKVAGLTPSINMILPYAAPPVQEVRRKPRLSSPRAASATRATSSGARIQYRALLRET